MKEPKEKKPRKSRKPGKPKPRKVHLAYDPQYGPHPCGFVRRGERAKKSTPPRFTARFSKLECKRCLAYCLRFPQLGNRMRAADAEAAE
jgi:hypothetical protein